MPEYDAFGRRADEDPLAVLRGQDLEQPATAPQPAAERPVRARRPGGRRSPRWWLPLVVAGVVAGPIIGGVVGVISAVDDTTQVVDGVREGVGDVREAVDDLAATPPPSASGEAKGPVTGLRRGSLLTRAELAPALAGLRGLGNLRHLRIAPDRIQAQLVAERELRIVHVEPGGEPQVITRVAGAGVGGQRFSFARLDPAAPSRLVRSAAGRLRLPTTRIDYVLAWGDGWNAYFKDGAGIFQGDARGRVVRRIS